MKRLDADTVTTHYITAALWSSTDDEGEPLDAVYSADDIAPDTLKTMREDVSRFLAQCEAQSLDIHYAEAGGTDEQFGHDLWLTRNHHGAGFWDRGMGGIGERLTDLAHSFGEVWLYVGDDGLIYC